MRILLVFCLSLSFLTLSAQDLPRLNFPFQINNRVLANPLVGGLTSPQYSEVDLNNDGIQDLYVFDRAGDVSICYINEGTPNQSDYRFAPEYNKQFPHLESWVLLRDFNQDGAMDIFTFSGTPAGVIAYKGKYENNKIAFDRINFPNIYNILFFQQTSGNETNILINFDDYPSIDDIDGDGDLDIVTFASNGGNVHLYANQSVERGHGLDSLLFILEDNCWGKFYESGFNKKIDLSTNINTCITGFNGPIAQTRHAGSTLLTLDLDNDNDKELILGDISFTNLTMLTNGGDNQTAFMVSQDTAFPSYDVPFDLPIFASSFYLDVDNDGRKDLLASQNSGGVTGEDYECSWFYKNVGSNEFPDFELQQKDLFVEDMIDLGTGAYPAFFDYNADGLMDLLVGNLTYYQLFGVKDARLALFENIGTGTNPSYRLVDDNYLDANGIINGITDLAPCFGDIDSDGDVDLLLGTQTGKMIFYENIAGPNMPVVFAQGIYHWMDIDVGNSTKPQIVDLNRDGKMDLLIGEKNISQRIVGNDTLVGHLNYIENIGTATSPAFNPEENEAPNIIAFGGVDTRFDHPQDGYSAPVLLDFEDEFILLVGSVEGTIKRYSNIENNLNGRFDLVENNFGNIDDGTRIGFSVADVDNDDVLEMIVGNFRGGLTAYQTNISTDGIFVSSTEELVPELKSISLYPNPTRSILNIDLGQLDIRNTQIKIYSSIGQLIKTQVLNDVISQIDMQDFSSGIYFCEIQNETGRIVKKFVVD